MILAAWAIASRRWGAGGPSGGILHVLSSDGRAEKIADLRKDPVVVMVVAERQDRSGHAVEVDMLVGHQMGGRLRWHRY